MSAGLEFDYVVGGVGSAGCAAASAAMPAYCGPGAGAVLASSRRTRSRRRADTVYHPEGGCGMGVDDMAVVDPQLCVGGLQRLRVADASIMPTLIGHNTNASAIMIGEKAAALIADGRHTGGFA